MPAPSITTPPSPSPSQLQPAESRFTAAAAHSSLFLRYFPGDAVDQTAGENLGWVHPASTPEDPLWREITQTQETTFQNKPANHQKRRNAANLKSFQQ